MSASATPRALTAGPLELEKLITEVLENNRDLQAVQARAAALKKETPAAGALEDPKVGFGLTNMPTDTFAFDQEPMTQKQIFVSQKIPWFGKRGLKEQIAELKSAREAVVVEARKLELTRRISDMFYRLWFIDRELENNRLLKEMLVQILEVAQSGYATGKAQEYDLIQVQLEISLREDRRISLEAERRALDRDINGLLNRPTFQSIAPPRELTEPGTVIERDSLKQALLENNPRIRIKRIELQMAELETDLADKDFWPDSEWRLTYGQRDEIMNEEMADFLSATVMFNVPLWQSRRQGPVRDAKKEMAHSARMELDNLLATLPYEAAAVSGEIEDLVKNYRFFKDVMIHQAGQLARSSLSSYQVGKIDFDIMIRTHIRQLEVNLKTDKYLQMIHTKRAGLDELIGK